VRLLTLEQAAGEDAAQIGGKAIGLVRLAALGLPVPDTFVLPSAAYARWLTAGLDEGEAEALWGEVVALGPPLAVRSSSADEDGAGRSAAGQYESVMDVRSRDDLRRAITRCFEAATSARASSYREDSAAPQLAVVVQRELAAERAGVAFSADPLTGAREDVVIEAVFGHGEGLVSGALAPDRYLVERASGRVRARLAEKPAMADGRGGISSLTLERRTSRTLRDHEARAVAELVVRAEAGFRTPVDVEFCFVGESLWLLQCRPITSLHDAG